MMFLWYDPSRPCILSANAIKSALQEFPAKQRHTHGRDAAGRPCHGDPVKSVNLFWRDALEEFHWNVEEKNTTRRTRRRRDRKKVRPRGNKTRPCFNRPNTPNSF
jgi:hypothetical protein